MVSFSDLPNILTPTTSNPQTLLASKLNLNEKYGEKSIEGLLHIAKPINCGKWSTSC